MTRLIAPALFLLATPALADLTAEEVLADHLNLLSLYGALEMETTGTRMAPDGLVVEGFTGLWESEDLTARITTPGVTLTETPDGAVTLTYADRLPITLVIDPEGAEEQRIDLTLDAQGLTHRVTGAANDLTHAIAFDALTLGEIRVSPEETAENTNFSGELRFTGLKATLSAETIGHASRQFDIALGGLTQRLGLRVDTDVELDLNGSPYRAEGDGQFDGTMTLSDLRLIGSYADGELPHHSAELTIGQIATEQAVDMAAEGQMAGKAKLRDLTLSYDLRMPFEGWEEDPEAAFKAVQSARLAFNVAELDYDMDLDAQDSTETGTNQVKMQTQSALRDLGFNIHFQGGEVIRHGAGLSLAALAGDFDMDVENEGRFAGDFGLDGLSLTYDLNLSPEDWETDLRAALDDGQSISGGMVLDGMRYEIDAVTPEETVQLATRFGQNTTRLSFGKSGASFYSASNDIDTRISGPAMAPLPLTSLGYRLSHSLIDLSVPLLPSEDSQPFHMRMMLEDLVVDDALWDLFDPNAQLPRTPARLDVDLAGATVIKEDLFAGSADMPFGATEMLLKTLVLDLAGVSLDGQGALSGTITPAAPVGEGHLDLTMTGLHDLMDTLIALGLLPEEQAMGARMMLGLFARPGETEGELVSKIELNEAGQIFANGQRIK